METMTKWKLGAGLLVLNLFMSTIAAAQANSPPATPGDGDPPDYMPRETVREYIDRMSTVGETVREEANRAVATATRETAKKNISNQTPTAAPASDFGNRVNDSLANFLPLLEFAGPSLSTADDNMSATLRFNSLPVGRYGALSIEGTVSEPTLYRPLLEEIAESARATQETALLKQLDDFSDLTWTLTYGFQRSDELESWNTARHRYGRQPELYTNLIDQLVASLTKPAFDDTLPERAKIEGKLNPLENRLQQWITPDPDHPPDCPNGIDLDGNGQPDQLPKEYEDLTFEQIEAAMKHGCLGDFSLAGYVQGLQAEVVAFKDVAEGLQAVPYHEFTPLIANQPQLTLTAAFRQTDDLVGPDSAEYKLSYEMGRRNLNRVLKGYHALRTQNADGDVDAQRRAAFESVVNDPRLFSQDKFTFSAIYRRRDPYKLDLTYQETAANPITMMDTTIDRTASLNLDRSEEICGKLQWTRFTRLKGVKAGANGDSETDFNEPQPWLALSAEYIDVQDDPMRQNRLVGKFTYTLPVSGTSNFGVPVTVVYANKSEFLGNPDYQLSAHVGLSFDIDRKNN